MNRTVSCSFGCPLVAHFPAGGAGGGGGGGGRVALHHAADNHFSGVFVVHGGAADREGGAVGEGGRGGAGTAYVQSASERPRLLLDNANPNADCKRITEREQMDLTVVANVPAKADLWTASGVHITSTGAPYRVNCGIGGTDFCYSWLANVVRSSSGYYYSGVRTATVTATMPGTMYVDHVRVYPACVR